VEREGILLRPGPNGSRVYCVHLKTSQRDNRYATVRGLTVAMFYIDQLEEVPEDVYNEAGAASVAAWLLAGNGRQSEPGAR
jgi:hypothetical protein